LKELIEVDDKFLMRDNHACKDYKRLVSCYALDYRPETVWTAMGVAKEEDIIIDTNGAFNRTFRYLIFNDYEKYQKYIQKYTDDRNFRHPDNKSMYEDQYQIIPSTAPQRLVFNVVEATETELKYIIELAAAFFKSKHDNIVVIGKPSKQTYEIALLGITGNARDNNEHVLAFIDHVGKLHPEIVSKISAKRIMSDGTFGGLRYITFLQTPPIRNGLLQTMVQPVINLLCPGTTGPGPTQTSGNREHDGLAACVAAHPPHCTQPAREYYAALRRTVGNVTETAIRKELIEQNFVPGRNRSHVVWLKRATS
jgi:hypothetical protein